MSTKKPASKLKERIMFFCKLAFSGGLIAFLIFRGDLDFSVIFSASEPKYLVLCVLFCLLSAVVNNHRWTLLLWAQGFKTTWRETASLTLVGLFFNFSLPSSVGGDAVKAYYLAQDNIDKRAKAITSVIVDRILGLFAMLSIASLSFLFVPERLAQNGDIEKMALPVWGLFAGLTVFLGMAFSSKLRRHSLVQRLLGKGPALLKKVYDAFSSFGESKVVLAKVIALSLVSQASVVLFIVSFGYAIGQSELPFGLFMFAVPIGLIVMALPIAPAGVGVGQLAFLTLFQMYLGEKSQVGQLGITAFQLILLCLGLFGAIIYLKRKRRVSFSQFETFEASEH